MITQPISEQDQRQAITEAFDNGHAMKPFVPNGSGNDLISRCNKCGMEVMIDAETGRVSGTAKISKCLGIIR